MIDKKVFNKARSKGIPLIVEMFVILVLWTSQKQLHLLWVPVGIIYIEILCRLQAWGPIPWCFRLSGQRTEIPHPLRQPNIQFISSLTFSVGKSSDSIEVDMVQLIELGPGSPPAPIGSFGQAFGSRPEVTWVGTVQESCYDIHLNAHNGCKSWSSKVFLKKTPEITWVHM